MRGEIVSGFVAVVSVEPGRRVETGEVEALARAYETLRGSSPRTLAKAGWFGQAIVFSDPARPHTALVQDASGWAAKVGVPHGFTTPGETRPDELDGQWALLAYRSATDELSLSVDPTGQQPAYIARAGGRVYVSTSLLALAKHLDASPSVPGILSFLRLGFQFGAATAWEGIERLDPATEVQLRADGLSQRTYWRPEPDVALMAMHMRDATEHAAGIIVDACRGKWHGHAPLMTDLTGGYDSRMMNAALDQAGVSFDTNTAGEQTQPDVIVAQEVARAAGWSWRRFGLPPDWADSCEPWVDAALAWGDGHLQVLQLAGVLRMHEDRSQTHQRVFMGGGFETFRGHSWVQQPFSAGRSNTIDMRKWVDFRCLGNLDLSVFRSDPSQAVRSDVTDRLHRYVEPWKGHLNTVQLDVLDSLFATAHYGAYAGAARGMLDLEVPGFLRPIWTAAFSIHPSQRRFRRMQRHLLEHLRADVARIRTAGGGPAQPVRVTNAHLFASGVTETVFRSVRKKLEIATGKPLRAATSVGVQRQTAARVATVRSLGLDDAGGRASMRSARLFDPERLGQMCDNAGALPPVQAATLARILTVEMALRACDAEL